MEIYFLCVKKWKKKLTTLVRQRGEGEMRGKVEGRGD